MRLWSADLLDFLLGSGTVRTFLLLDTNSGSNVLIRRMSLPMITLVVETERIVTLLKVKMGGLFATAREFLVELVLHPRRM